MLIVSKRIAAAWGAMTQPKAETSSWNSSRLARQNSNPVAHLRRIGSSKTPNFRPKDFAGLSAFARAKLKRPPRRETLVAAFWKQAGLPF